MVVLKNIPRILSPQLLSVLARMGHADEIVLGDANFPSASICSSGPEVAQVDGGVKLQQRRPELVRADGLEISALLKAILSLLPLDAYVACPAAVMAVVEGDKVPSIWKQYQKIMNEAEGKEVKLEEVERFQFYERAKRAYAVVATGEGALYGNIILKKGVLPPEN